MTDSSAPAAVRPPITLRAMTQDDVPAAHALTAELRWPHRPADWEHALKHAEGLVVEAGGEVIGTGLRWLYGTQAATIGLIVVSPAWQGQRIGHRLMTALLDELDDRVVLLHATAQGRGLYERLGFVMTGELNQHQGTALPAPLIALATGLRLRAAAQNDTEALQALDAAARGMQRAALIDDLRAQAKATVVLDEQGEARGFAMLRRFGRGHVIGPVVAPDAEGAKALIAHLAGMNAGKFTRIDVDPASGLGDWLEKLGLAGVDAPTTMLRGGPLPRVDGGPGYHAIVTQAIG